MASTLVLASIGFAMVYVFLWIIIYSTQDAREPPLVETRIPFLGSLVGIIRGKTQFYLDQRDKHGLPIYTLRLPFQRVYVINATELIPAFQKQWRLVSFAPLFAGAGKVVGMSQHACDLMHQHLTDEEKNFNLVWVSLLAPKLMSGSPGLDALNRKAIEVLAEDIDDLARESSQVTVGLQEWTLRAMLMATTDAVYGPLNPYRDAAVAKAWNTVELNFLTLVLTPFPSIFSRGVLRARELLAAAFLEFIHKGGKKTASIIVQTKHDHHSPQISLDDVARTEIANSFAVLGNTTPSAWWMVYHVFSDKQVLQDIREEVSVLVSESEEVCSIDLTNIRTNCPILLSTFQETLRYRAVSNSVRKVLEDVMLDGRFLLKKGSMVFLPHPVQHTSVKAFGPDAAKFDHLRFTRERKQQQKGIPSKKSFYAFGGGHGTCPGRHFASMEIMALAAMMALRFDITPVEVTEDGKWVEPSCENSPAASGMPYPDEEIRVRIRPRGGGKTWKVTYSGSDDSISRK